MGMGRDVLQPLPCFKEEGGITMAEVSGMTGEECRDFHWSGSCTPWQAPDWHSLWEGAVVPWVFQ